MAPPSVDSVSLGEPPSGLASADVPPCRRIDHGGTGDEYRVAHEALKANSETWQSLSFAGIQHDGRGGLVELRHCPSCQSTIARPIAPLDALFLCELQADIAARAKQAIFEAKETSGR